MEIEIDKAHTRMGQIEECVRKERKDRVESLDI